MSAKGPREIRKCLECNGEFSVRLSPSRADRGKFCSRSCNATFNGKKHGHSGHRWQSRTYNSWAMMLQRCTNPSTHNYQRYGGAGITVDPLWHDFSNFLTDMGERPDGMTLDRKDSRAGYSKNNCRWSTPTEQQHNIRSNVFATYNGRTQCISAWAKEFGITPSVLEYRLKRGWGDKAFTVPVKHGNRIILGQK